MRLTFLTRFCSPRSFFRTGFFVASIGLLDSSITRWKYISEFTRNNLPNSRFNKHIPFGQRVWTFNSVFVRFHFFFCKPDSLLIWLFYQRDNGLYPFPCHRTCPIDWFWYWIQYFSVPMLLQYSPTSFNRIVLAMIGRIANQADSQTCFVTEFGHSANELSPTACGIRTIVKSTRKKSREKIDFI